MVKHNTSREHTADDVRHDISVQFCILKFTPCQLPSAQLSFAE